MSAQESASVLKAILEFLGVEASVSVNERDNISYLEIDAQDQGMLIGYHGETLNSLQNIIRVINFKKEGDGSPIVVDIGGYRAQRSEKLRTMAVKSAEKARFLDTQVSLPPLSPTERREVHLFVKEISGVMSESLGEGENRHIIIKPEKKEDN